MRSTPSLPSLPGPLTTLSGATTLGQSIGQIQLNCLLVLNWIVWRRTVFRHWNCSNYYMMSAFVVWVPVRGSLSLFRYETHTRPEEDEGRKVSERREVDRTDKSTEENRAVSRREQELGLWTQAKLANIRRWVSIPSGFVGISLEYTLTVAHRMLGQCHRLLPSCTWS